MSKLKETQLSTKQVYSGSFLDVRKDEVELPNGKTSTREWIKHPGAACIIPVLPDGKIALIKQYRYPVKRELIELPAGKLDSGEEPEECAKRELEEEIGYSTGDEFLELMPTPLNEAVKMVWNGQITDVKTIIGLLWAERLMHV